MKILSDTDITSKEEAITLALQTAGMADMDTSLIGMFAFVANSDKLYSEGEKVLASTIRNRYGNKTTRQDERWFVPVPRLHYASKDIPQLIIAITIYLVSSAIVETPQNCHFITLMGNVGKTENLSIPLVFLHAILMRDLERFTVIARDPLYTTWDIPGTKPVRLPNDFLNQLFIVLQKKSVTQWLSEFGSQGKCVASLVAGNLLGLAFKDTIDSGIITKEMVTTDSLIAALEGLAFRRSEAVAMVKRAIPYLSNTLTMEKAIKVTLQLQGEANNA